MSTQDAQKYPYHRSGRFLRPGCFSSISRLIAFLVLVILVSSIWIADQALPGDTLYPFKIWLEKARSLLYYDQNQQLEYLDITEQHRLDEAQNLLNQGRIQDVIFYGPLVISSTDGNWLVGGLPVRIRPETQVVGDIKQGIYVSVKGLTQSEGYVAAEQITSRTYQIYGKLLNVTANTWRVDDFPIIVTPDTILRGMPELGDSLHVVAWKLADKNYLAHLVELDQ